MKNRDIWEAYPALAAVSQNKLPKNLAWRVVLNDNHMKPVFEGIAKARERMIVDGKVGPQHAETEGYAERLKEFSDEWMNLMESEVEWKTPAAIEAKSLNALKEFEPAGWAPLLRIGIVVHPDGFQCDGE